MKSGSFARTGHLPLATCPRFKPRPRFLVVPPNNDWNEKEREVICKLLQSIGISIDITIDEGGSDVDITRFNRIINVLPSSNMERIGTLAKMSQALPPNQQIPISHGSATSLVRRLKEDLDLA